MTVPVYIRSLIFTLIAPTTVVGWLPYWIANSKLDSHLIGKAPDIFLTDLIGYLLIAVGAAIYLWCVYDFTFIGRGTPAIFDPPKKLVIRGLYKYMRNPMYIGVLTAILGQVFVYGSLAVFLYGICWWIVFSLFVHFYEERALCKQFGEDYLHYLQKVNRWFPSFKS